MNWIGWMYIIDNVNMQYEQNCQKIFDTKLDYFRDSECRHLSKIGSRDVDTV